MAHVGGPCSSLPGALLKLPKGQTCDEHGDRFAVVRVQGETDSFGYEAIDMCEECFNNFKQHQDSPDNYLNESTCEICNTSDVKVTPTRDPEEGLYGRVYHACDKCRSNLLSG